MLVLVLVLVIVDGVVLVTTTTRPVGTVSASTKGVELGPRTAA
ncbi:MAG: hypothetical protein AB7N76_20890 [Planctomycetota bacterium]